jgi:hypothetical protein
MQTLELLETLRQLEQRLLRSDVRANPAQLAALLHPAFIEVGASGRTYSREEVLAEFNAAAPDYTVWSQDYVVEVVLEGLALLRYRSAHIDELGRLSRHVSRTSLWQRTGSGWQARFHQGTPTEAFKRHAT